MPARAAEHTAARLAFAAIQREFATKLMCDDADDISMRFNEYSNKFCEIKNNTKVGGKLNLKILLSTVQPPSPPNPRPHNPLQIPTSTPPPPLNPTNTNSATSTNAANTHHPRPPSNVQIIEPMKLQMMRTKDGDLMFPLISPPIPAPRTRWSTFMKRMHDRAKKAKALKIKLKQVHPTMAAKKLGDVKEKAMSEMESAKSKVVEAKVTAQGQVREAKSEGQAQAQAKGGKSELSLSIPVNQLPSESGEGEEDGPPVAVSLTDDTTPQQHGPCGLCHRHPPP